MTQLMDSKPLDASTDTDSLAAAIQRVLAASPEPLTLPKIRSGLPAALRQGNLEEVLRRQVAANVIHQYPKYRSQHDRYWDRPMPVHIAALIQTALAEGPLGWSELRRKLPAYTQEKAESIVNEQLGQKRLHRHPRSGRGGERIGLRPAEARDYLRDELGAVFNRLEQLGFSQSQVRAGALELLHDEEWAPAPPQPKNSSRNADKGSPESPREQSGQPGTPEPGRPAPAPSAAASQQPGGTSPNQP